MRGFMKTDTDTMLLSQDLPWSQVTYDRRSMGSAVVLDTFGLFPVVYPYGSNYSVRVGHAENGTRAESLSYTFTVPADQNEFRLLYYYAVVLNDFNHPPVQQPRFQSKVFNVTLDKYIDCASYTYVTAPGLSGFQVSSKRGAGNTPVYYRSWTPVTVNLLGVAGQTLRFEFSVNGCSRPEGRHFAYAYINIDDRCGDAVEGNVACRDFSSLTLRAPTGFLEYTWFDVSSGQQLGKESTLRLSPVPAEGGLFGVRLLSDKGPACESTLITPIRRADAPFHLSLLSSVDACAPGFDLKTPGLAAGSSPMQFSYWTNPAGTEPLSIPFVVNSGTYYVKGVNAEGCSEVKPVSVTIHPLPFFTVTSPAPVKVPQTIDLSATTNNSSLRYEYFKDAAATIKVADPYRVSDGGMYYIKGIAATGCFDVKPVSLIVHPLFVFPNAFTPNQDGHNDVFCYRLVGGLRQIVQFQIFTRWGQLVFSTNTVGRGWDGTFKGSALPVGSYCYVFKAIDPAGQLIDQRGSLLLVR